MAFSSFNFTIWTMKADCNLHLYAACVLEDLLLEADGLALIRIIH